MGEIDADVLKGRAGVSGDVCGTIIFKPGKHVGLEIVLHEVDVAFFKFEHAHHGVGHDFENHAGQRRPFVPIIRIALELTFSPGSTACNRNGPEPAGD